MSHKPMQLSCRRAGCLLTLFVIVASLSSFVGGCAAGGPTASNEQHQQNLETGREWLNVAQEGKAKVYLFGQLPTRAEFYNKTGFGSDGHLTALVVGDFEERPPVQATIPLDAEDTSPDVKTLGATLPAAEPAVPTTVLVRIDDVDADEDKGFGRLADGTLVVVLGAADKLGQTVTGEVTALGGSREGRLIMARLMDGP